MLCLLQLGPEQESPTSPGKRKRSGSRMRLLTAASVALTDEVSCLHISPSGTSSLTNSHAWVTQLLFIFAMSLTPFLRMPVPDKVLHPYGQLEDGVLHCMTWLSICLTPAAQTALL